MNTINSPLNTENRTPRVMTVAQAAPEVGVKPMTLYTWCREGTFPHRRIGRGRNIRILREDIEAFLASCAR